MILPPRGSGAGGGIGGYGEGYRYRIVIRVSDMSIALRHFIFYSFVLFVIFGVLRVCLFYSRCLLCLGMSSSALFVFYTTV